MMGDSGTTLRAGTIMTPHRIAIVFAGAVGLGAAGNLPFGGHPVWIDPVTGSMSGQTRWPGVPVHGSVQRSTIERWVQRHEGRYAPRWRFLCNAEDYLLAVRTAAILHRKSIVSTGA